ncbi:MAG: DNA replication/repair protein RecF [Chitinophagales bacterium]
MFLTSINILNYKNYSNAAVSFTNKFNLINGLNGSGKTNLIDAIYYLCLCKSYFTRSDADVMKHDENYFRLDGNFISGDQKDLITAKFTVPKKEFFRNNLVYERLSDHIGSFPVVMIAPDDIAIINDGSEERRRFLDTAIAQVNHIYLQRLILYNKILQQRNIVLKNYGLTGKLDRTLINVLNNQLAVESEFIYHERKKYLAEFSIAFSELYHLISGEQEAGVIEYQSQLDEHDHLHLLLNSLKEDTHAQRTTTGMHKDDLRLLVNGFPVREIGSQGQIKSFLIAMKLTQYSRMLALTGKRSILLLDDIFEKLDKKRLEVLFGILNDDAYAQIFMTDADEHRSLEFFEEHIEEFGHFKIDNNLIL